MNIERIKEFGHQARRRVGKFFFIALAAGVGTTGMIVLLVALLGAGWSSIGAGFIKHDAEHQSAVDCNVVALDVHGLVTTYRDDANSDGSQGTETDSGELVAHLEDAMKNAGTKAVLLDIDSPGGYPQGAREVVDALRTLGKPSVAWVRGSGDSAAYWIASAASTIVASPESDVGSIGVTSSYTDVSKQNKEQGITYNSLSTGKFKDTGNPDKPLTEEERAYYEHQNNIVLEDFIADVAAFRHLAIDKVRAIADGSTVHGREAKDLGLIDSLGTKQEVLAALKEKIHEEPRICWPQYQ